MSRLCGGVCGAVQRRRHLGCKRIQPSDIAADSVRRRAALPSAETSVPAGLSEQGAFDGANAISRLSIIWRQFVSTAAGVFRPYFI
jgi:hypothetical protein